MKVWKLFIWGTIDIPHISPMAGSRKIMEDHWERVKNTGEWIFVGYKYSCEHAEVEKELDRLAQHHNTKARAMLVEEAS
jgi:hypothetical protein